MGNIKYTFTIKDFEYISEIKAHTIRIWEKRYGLFNPSRASNKIRSYSIADLKKLLNVVVLQKSGYKISKIAELPTEEIAKIAHSNIKHDLKSDFAVSQLKVAMYSFDTHLFETIYQDCLTNSHFKIVFKEVFAPFLAFVGGLWQTDHIGPVHEHFISNLVYQKIQGQIDQLELVELNFDKKAFILFLPEEEMHEIGLMYLNYDLRSRGYQTVYLGRSIPLTDLQKLKDLYNDIVWVCSFTMNPNPAFLAGFLDDMKRIAEPNHQFLGIGRMLVDLEVDNLPANFNFYPSIKEAIEKSFFE